ncbi:MAG TPA: DUF4197 domain-containing protein [Methylomirabilota bacterium]|nr:DUF4197 domain-containing protein [Methylomirabilota bacterium]
MNRARRALLRSAALGLWLRPTPANAQLDRFLQGLGVGGGLSDAKLASGLKEALRVGTEKTVDLTGKLDGYFANQAIKILMPEKLRTVESGLRTIGYGDRVDEFVLSMNRAAERAAPAARGIFGDAVTEMTFDDVRKVWSGGDNAATEYFRGKTTPKLTAAFTPVVDKAMGETGVTRQYKELIGRFNSIPFMKTESFDIDRYVVDKSLGGLFHVLGEQEKQIRTNPAARTTDLLKEVFGAKK